jgi:hypothetical protein
MRLPYVLFVTLGLMLVACQNTAPQIQSPTRALGVLKVDFDLRQKSSRVVFSPVSQIQPQAFLSDSGTTGLSR